MPDPINNYVYFSPVQPNTGSQGTNLNNTSWRNVLSQNNGSNIAIQFPLRSAYTEQQPLLGSTALASNPYGFSGMPYAGLVDSTTNALTSSAIPSATNGLYGGNTYGAMSTRPGNTSGMRGATGSTNLYGADSTVFGSANDLYSASLGGNINLYGGGAPGLNGTGAMLPGMGMGGGTGGPNGAGSMPTINLYGANSSVFGSASDIYGASLGGNPNPYGGGMGTTGNTGMGGMPRPGTSTVMGNGGMNTVGMVGAGSTPNTNLYGASSTVFGSANDIYGPSMAGTTNLYGGTSTTFGTANSIYATSMGGMPRPGTGSVMGNGGMVGAGSIPSTNLYGASSTVFGSANDIYRASMAGTTNLYGGTSTTFGTANSLYTASMGGMPGMGNGGGALPTSSLPPSTEGVFRLAAAGEGRPDMLSGAELVTLLLAYAPTGAFNLDSFQRFGLDVGIDRATATRAFIGSTSNGTLPLQTVFNAAVTQGDRQNNTWNAAQFGQVIGMIASSGAPSANPTQSAFNYLSGGQPTLTPQSLQSQIGIFTRGDTFSLPEFQDFGSLLNVTPNNSAAIYDAFQRATFGQPSIKALAAFASQRADPTSGTWTTAQFAQVAQDLALLGASTPIPTGMPTMPTAMSPSTSIPAGPTQMPGMNMNLPGVPGMPGMPTSMPDGHDHAHYTPFGYRNHSLH